MVTRNDCLLVLAELKSAGVNTASALQDLSKNNIENCIKFINSYRPFDLGEFYEKVRKSYNNHKSKLYINIVKDEVEESSEVVTTLSALSLQILLYKPSDEVLFLKSSRLEQIHKVILHYVQTYDLIPAMQLLQLIKSDLKIFEKIRKE